MEWLIKFPVKVQALTPGGKYKTIPRFASGILDIDHQSHISFRIEFLNGRKSFRFYAAKYYLYETLMHNLLIRPIRKPQKNKMWINNKIFNGLTVPPETMDVGFVTDYHTDARERIETYLGLDLDERERRIATEQLKKLLDRQRAVDLLDPASTIMALTSL